jgi:tellurite resistance protein TerC
MGSRLSSIATPLTWVGFVALIVALLALDLGLFNRRSREVSPRRALFWSALWVVVSAGVATSIAVVHDARPALEFTSGYVLEKALAIDNLFVMALLFRHFGVPARHQHRVLYWGILGALVMRGALIAVGAALIARFSWVLYAFGAVLLVAGAHLALQREEAVPAEGLIVRVARKILPLTRRLQSSAFWVVERNQLKATPLVLALVTIEVSDVVFALDSIPAVFAVTRDPFIVFSSNICAVLGMRSLYFLLAHMLERFHYLKFGLAAVLCFVGLRLLFSHFVDVPIALSLGVIVVLIAGAIGLSWFERKPQRWTPPQGAVSSKRRSIFG